MSSNFYQQAAWFCAILERYVLSVFYLAYAVAYVLMTRELFLPGPAWVNADYAQFAQDASMFLLLLFEGGTLLFGRRAVTTPRNMEELVVPIVTSFFYLTYTYLGALPEWMYGNVAPDKWQWPLQFTGLGLDTLGTLISVWGVIYLGRSFGIFVAVRKVVMRGPYRFVRHPIYCGYLFMFAGLALSYFTPLVFVLVGIHYWLFIYRARLEEARLAEYSPAYQEYMKGAGFMLPKIFGQKRPAAGADGN